MKLKNTAIFNISVYAVHTKGGLPAKITVPAGATLELPDAEWAKFANQADAVEALVVTLAPKVSAAEAKANKAKAVAEAKKLIAEAEKEAKAAK